MEACDAYKPWHDKQTHKTYLRPCRIAKNDETGKSLKIRGL
jgi:hypothetical protein